MNRILDAAMEIKYKNQDAVEVEKNQKLKNHQVVVNKNLQKIVVHKTKM